MRTRAVLPGPAHLPRRARFVRISTAALLSLGAILAVLVFVSIPRLRSLAQQENEADAHATLELFRGALTVLAAERPARAPPLSLEELARPAPISRSLSDGEFLADGLVLRRHGYLFRLVEVPGAQGPGILAWPWEHGTTGKAAFLFTPDGRIFRHPNTPASWNGPTPSLEPAPIDGGWFLAF